jgi:predicted ATPase/DNA-binding SARP family transcriptional activator
MEPRPVLLLLFGVPTLDIDGVRTVLTAERPHMLLAYLACRRDWVRRDEIAEMFWPQHLPAAARNNLRKVLLLAARIPGAQTLEREDDRVRWTPDSDLARFERACDEERYADAMDIYSPPLLGGSMESAFTDSASDWLASERARLEERWRAACAARLAQLADEPGAAAALARRLLEVDPLNELAVTSLARAHLALGQADVAAQALASFRHRAANHLAVQPSSALVALETEAQLAPLAPRVRTGLRSAEFVGRRRELAEIAHILEAPLSRCLTLAGPGGIGKTVTCRMAAAAFAERSGHRVAWIAVDDLTDVSQVPGRIAGRLGFVLDGTRDAWPQVAAALRREPILLVIDNMEHLDLAPACGQLLEVCADLRLLITSRASVGVPGEQLLAIEGLPLPDDDERDPDVLRACDSVRLFDERALAVNPRFELAHHAVALVRLLHLVEGLPMAIELAAAWTHVLPVDRILGELQRSVDLLDTRAARSERGLRASFEQSWRLLDADKQNALARLALLPGSVGTAMALRVGQAPLPLLASLVDQSLLQATGDGRFTMHGLIRQCAAAKASDVDGVERLHRAFVASWLEPQVTPAGSVSPSLLEEIDQELPHARAAWAHAVSDGDASAIAAMAPAMARHFHDRGQLVEGIDAFVAAVRALEATASGGGLGRQALLLSLRALGRLQYLAGQTQAAESHARRLLALAGDGDAMLVMPALNTVGCPRRLNSEPPCRLNIEPGAEAGSELRGCGQV